MKDIAALQRKYSRPARLSDPCHDNSAKSLQDLLALSDDELTWSDFRTLLGPHLPAGTYQEVAYFLPLAFRYIREHPDEALDLCSSLVWFCSEYSKQLQADGFLESVREAIAGLLHHWTKSFELMHFDELACRAKGWRTKHFDHVKNSEVVYQSLEDLVEYVANADLAETFISGLASFQGDPTRAAWLVEAVRSLDDPYHPPDIPLVTGFANDLQLLRRAVDVAVSDTEIRTASPTYWEDTCILLGLETVH
jgi:hypothetical protein